ncbi:MAG: glycosyltransferase family 39 protein [Saprospiraceae bacterium]|nr:glycosyltransferase family 39 protein [Saprospiraceae bacterium]MBP6445640.1 glycosyltransferase family 39 protein [Saprospiraceae bacterium]
MKTILHKYFLILDTGKILVVFFLLTMFLPRIVKKGMFGDGLLYSSMSRNLAEGRGSYWQPFFSSSYWLEDMPTTYFENPPLMIWVQSLFFKILGDHWWTEKLFCVVILMVNIWIFKKLWVAIFYQKIEYQKYWHLVPFWWFLIPVVIWGNVNNLMDNMLLTFCLSALYFIMKSIQYENVNEIKYAVLAGGSIFFGVLTKGPVALYPIAFPAILWLTNLTTFRRAFLTSLLSFLVAFGILTLLLAFQAEAHYFFNQYWEQRLKAVITGSRDDMILKGWDRLFIVKQLLIELSPMIGIMIIAAIVLKINKINLLFQDQRREIFAFVLLGLSATLPILASTKQSGIYLIPGIPMFSIAAAIISVPVFRYISTTKKWNILKFNLGYFAFSGCIIVLIFSFLQFGKPGREEALIHDVELLKSHVPDGSKVGVCKAMMSEFVLHTYLQRMNKYELTDYTNNPEYILSDHFCNNKNIPQRWSEYHHPEADEFLYFKVYKR